MVELSFDFVTAILPANRVSVYLACVHVCCDDAQLIDDLFNVFSEGDVLHDGGIIGSRYKDREVDNAHGLR